MMDVLAFLIEPGTVAIGLLLIAYLYYNQHHRASIRQSGKLVAKVLLPGTSYRNKAIIVFVALLLWFKSGAFPDNTTSPVVVGMILALMVVAATVLLLWDANSYIEVREHALVVDNTIYPWTKIKSYTWLKGRPNLRLRISGYGGKYYTIDPKQKDFLNEWLQEQLEEVSANSI